MRVALLIVNELEPGRRVAWTMLTDTLGGPRWTGTKVTWDLKALDGGFTEVLFQQTGWPEENFGGDWHISLAGLTFAWSGGPAGPEGIRRDRQSAAALRHGAPMSGQAAEAPVIATLPAEAPPVAIDKRLA